MMIKFIELDESYYEVAAQNFVDVYNLPPWNDQWEKPVALTRIREFMQSPRALGIMAVDDEGSFLGAIIGETETYYDGMQFYIHEFWVALNQQGCGLGPMLVGELERRLKEKGYIRINLLTVDSQRTKEFYEKVGYKTAEKMILMGKTLE